MVEVFKTNVNSPTVAAVLIDQVCACLPYSRVNFDLEDEDNILRIESSLIIPALIINLFKANGFFCEVLD